MTGKGNKSDKAAHLRPCPECGKPATGNFCQHCGAALGGRFCNQCGAKLDADARFCNQCGAPVGAPAGGAAAGPGPGPGGGGGAAAARGSGARAWGPAAPAGARMAPTPAGPTNATAWYVAGVAVVGMIIVLAWPTVTGSRSSAPAGGTPAAGPAVGPSAVDLSTMTPREAADRLFNRVMTAAANGDSVEARSFLPMAIQSYQRAQPLDLDGLFHLSLLQRTGLQLDSALVTAQRILDKNPDHLLGLAAAAEAAAELGRDDLAKGYYQRLLDVYDAESAKQLEEYVAHERVIADEKGEAESYLLTH